MTYWKRGFYMYAAKLIKRHYFNVCFTNTNRKTFTCKTDKKVNDSRVDVSASNFWTRGQKAYFVIRIFDLLAPSHENRRIKFSQIKNKEEKMRGYGEKIFSFKRIFYTISIHYFMLNEPTNKDFLFKNSSPNV